MHRTHSFSLALVTVWALSAAVQAAAVPHLTPADVAAINHKMHALVDSNQAAGVVTLIVQDGKRVDLDAYGSADTEMHTPMRTDSVGAFPRY